MKAGCPDVPAKYVRAAGPGLIALLFINAFIYLLSSPRVKRERLLCSARTAPQGTLGAFIYFIYIYYFCSYMLVFPPPLQALCSPPPNSWQPQPCAGPPPLQEEEGEQHTAGVLLEMGAGLPWVPHWDSQGKAQCRKGLSRGFLEPLCPHRPNKGPSGGSSFILGLRGCVGGVV